MPPVVLQVIVDADKGIAELKQLDKALSDTTKATQQQTTAQKDATQSSTSFASSLAQSAKSAAGLALGFAGVAGIATTLSAAAEAATGFEAALNAIAALGTVSTGQLSKLREQLLALPPALGSSTELAKGLYDILGANVPAENAITVLTQSAELAKGGLGNLDTAINAVTKSAAAFGIPLEQAQFVTDVFTQTVVKGQGRLEEFAAAFPQVAATASAAGASFVDTNAAIAVLTQTFKNADTAATGLNSFMLQLIQNSAKFAAEGINVKQVLAEEGLTGIFRRLQEVTGGSAERMRELIQDQEGFRAALTLTGTQFETFNETVASYANVTGLAQQAASKNLEGATASWKTFINTLDRLVQEVAPPLLAAFTGITRVITTLATDITKLYRAFAQSEILRSLTADFQQFFQLIGQAEAFQTLNANLVATTASAGETYNAFVVLDELLKGNVRPTIDFVAAGWDLLNAAFDYTVAGVIKLGQYLVDGLITPLAQVAAALEKGLAAFGLADTRFAALAQASQQLSADLAQASATFQGMADEFVLGTNRLSTAQETAKTAVASTTKAVQGQAQAASAAAKDTTQLSEAQQKLNKDFEAANTAATGLKATLEKLKLGDVIKAISTEELERAVTTVIAQLTAMEESGKFSARQISQAYDDAAAVLRERFGALPAAFQTTFDAMRAKASTTADGIAAAFERLGLETRQELQRTANAALADFQTILQAGTATPEQLLDTWLDVVDQIDKAGFQRLPEGFQAVNAQMQAIARKAGVELPKPYVDAFGQIGLAAEEAGRKGAKAAADIDTSWLQSRGALERAKGTVEELAQSVVKLSDETQRLMDMQISVETRFASDVPGLIAQLKQARTELQGIQSNVITAAGGAPGERDFRIKGQLATIAAIQAALAKLGYDELGNPLPGTQKPGPGAPAPAPGATSINTGSIGANNGSNFGGMTISPLAPTRAPTLETATQRGGTTYQMVIQTQATDAATLARDLIPYLRNADLAARRMGG